ncbi:MAG TPA: FlgD immunoglobulin-like domain containing protein [Candidatus Cloacimonadota bacterium]|nr:FlgD immunoglobulin-like domain containing protein [Candidatus Cloacimonadota bacterium]
MRKKQVWLLVFGLIAVMINCAYAQGVNIQEERVLMTALGNVRAISSSGHYSYVVSRDTQGRDFINAYFVDYLTIWPISTTQLPVIDYSDHYRAIKVSGDLLCVFADNRASVFELTLTEPVTPVWRSDITMDGYFRNAEFDGNHLLTLYGGLLTSWDLTDPALPVVADSISIPNASSLFCSGTLAYLGLSNGEYQVVDFADPANIQDLGTNQAPIDGSLAGVMDHTLIVGSMWSVMFFDATDPLNPVNVGHVDEQGIFDVGELFLLGDKLVIRWYMELYHDISSHYSIHDISHPNLPQYLGSENINSNYLLYSDGRSRLILDKWQSYAFIDLNQEPNTIAEIGLSSFANIATSGNHAFIYQQNYALSSHYLDEAMPEPDAEIRVTDLQAMDIVGDLLVTSQSHGVGEDGWQYSPNVVSLYSLLNPYRFTLISSFTCTGEAWPTEEVRIVGDKLVLSNGSAGVAIYDISDFLAPVLWRSFDDQREDKSSILEGNYLYSGGVDSYSNHTIKIYDLSYPGVPLTIATIPLVSQISHMEKVGNLLYMISQNHTLRIWDVTYPALPVEYGTLTLPETPIDFLIHTNAMVVLFADSFAIYKLSDLLEGDPVGTCPLQGVGISLALRGNDVIIGTNNKAILYECRDAFAICNASGEDPTDVPQVQLLGCYPNPGRGFITIEYRLREAANITVDIYNSRGQRVNSMDYGMQETGPQTVVWSGEDEQGTACRSGIYYYRIRSKEYGVSGKMVLFE